MTRTDLLQSAVWYPGLIARVARNYGLSESHVDRGARGKAGLSTHIEEALIRGVRKASRQGIYPSGPLPAPIIVAPDPVREATDWPVFATCGKLLPLCYGTQDFIEYPWQLLPGNPPRDFERIVARRARVSVADVRDCGAEVRSKRITLRGRQHDLCFAHWNWKICREYRSLLKEYEHAVLYIAARLASRRTRLGIPELKRCAAWKLVDGTLYVCRKDVGIALGKYPADREAREALHALLKRTGEPTIVVDAELAAKEAQANG